MIVVIQMSTGERCSAVEIKNEKQFLDLQNRYKNENAKGKEKTDYFIKVIYFIDGKLDFVELSDLALPSL